MSRSAQGTSPARGAVSADDSAAAHLRGLLDVARLVSGRPDPSAMLATVARVVSETLGFATVVINRYRAATDEYEVTFVHGNDRARQQLLGDVSPASSWAPMLAGRFQRRGAYFVSAGSLDSDEDIRLHTPEPAIDPGEDANAWRPDDALFVTLDGAAGDRYGIVAVDKPRSRCRPDDETLDVLSAIAAQAGLAIESATHIHQLQTALARNRAVIETAPDGVIAIDRNGCVLEFNPAAEEMFGYSSAEAIGRELAELIVAPEDREAHRRGIRRALIEGQARLLNRWLEMMGIRSDGSPVATELTLTRVDGDDEAGTIVYGFIRDISERRRGEEQLAFMAYHDSLTGLPNRILVEQQLDLALARARRAEGAAALMFVDLDDFKDVNDKLGHAAGDQVLAAVSARLRGVLRDSDVLARQGGDEFLVVLSDLEADAAPAAEAVGLKLLSSLREPFAVAGEELRIGASLGISLYPDDAQDTEALLRHADAAMYEAKAGGGGRLVFHRPADTITARRDSVSSQLRRAITFSELELHYQPIWSLDEHRSIVGIEALLRWCHPDRGLLRPKAFMNLAEHSAVADDLIDWVLREGCRQVAAWRAEGLCPQMSLNMSPHQLLAPDLAARLSAEVGRHGLDTGQFMVELTESAWTVDAAETLAVITELRAAGVALAIDDFGAGYSSLSRLRELDYDVIKLDAGLMIDVPGDPTAVAVLRALIALARACRADIIAEGVESEDQVVFISAIGIDRAQGFLLGHPMRAHEMTPLLRRRLSTPPAPA